MDLINWKPFSSIDNFFGSSNFPKRFLNSAEFEWQPAADITETESEYLIKADLPEVKRDDITLKVDRRVITLTGERKRESEEKNENSLYREIYSGSFSRSFALPNNVDKSNITAEKNDGVLTVHLPKVAQTDSTTVDIKVN